jgi:PAS domain S-box-containing protein
MNILFDWLLPQNFLPHGHCYLWRPEVLWLHVSSDAVIAASYYAIPVALAYFVHRRRAVLPYWWVPVLFAMFIFLCGTTHLLNIWTVWRPDYIVDGLVKLATALASASTAVLVFASLPQAVALRTPIELQAEVEARTADLRAANERLCQEVAARQENELRMRLALEASGAATWCIDYTNGGREHFDVRSCELAGLDATRADWPAGTFCGLLHPDDRERMQLVFNETRAMARPGPLVEYRILTSRQEVRWLQGAGIVQRNAQGEPERFIGISTDITERKQTEAALATRTDELHQTFNAAATGLTRCSRKLHYIAANPAYAEISGVPLQQIIGRPIIDVMGREGFDRIRPYVERVLAGESVEYEVPVPFSISGTRLLHVAYAPWREADGSVSGWVASVTDVTARHEAEEKLKAASRQKDEFLAMLAHELRNPLAPICNATALLGHWLGSQHSEAKAALAILQRQTRQLTRIVDDLLDVARISEGQINLRKEAIDIGAVLDQAVETIQPLVQTKLHRLNIRKPFSPVFVDGDLARLVQSFGNILHNAAKYTDPGGEIEVEVKESKRELTIAVRDSGSGIAPDLLPKVFDLFTQGRRTVDRSEGGLGIGLTVVKKIIQLHGGSVSVDSAGVGCGTTVTVRLPTVQPINAPEAQQARFTAPRRRILVVDDNEDAANSLVMMLRLEGHDVSTAYSASGALSAAEQMQPELVFLDIGLPQIDGYEVARRLRIRNPSACPCLIALTGYGQPEDRARALAAGFAAHLTKPIDLEQLRHVLSSKPGADAIGTRAVPM